MKMALQIILLFFPWKIRRYLLNRFWKFEIHPTARIGFSYIYPKCLIMEEGARIGHLNVAVHLDRIVLRKNVSIARGNWITGFPTGTVSKHFAYNKKRKSELIVGKESAITKNHHIDCTDSIHIGDYVILAGYRSQFLTHSINIYESRQDCHPIKIGNYSFVSTGVIVLGGAILPDFSVLAAGAVLNKAYDEELTLYAGVPAKPKQTISRDSKYFFRTKGFIY